VSPDGGAIVIETHASVELLILMTGGSLCSAFLIAKLVLLAYEDLQNTWRKIKGSSENKS